MVFTVAFAAEPSPLKVNLPKKGIQHFRALSKPDQWSRWTPVQISATNPLINNKGINHGDKDSKNPRIPSFSKRALVSRISSLKENDRPARKTVILRAKIFLKHGPSSVAYLM